MAYDAPPLPVAMALGGELPEQGMFLVHQQGEGARRNFAAGVSRNAFEHGIVPVVRSKKSAYTLFFNGFVVGYKQYLPSLAQSLSRLVIQGLTDEDVRFAFRCPVGEISLWQQYNLYGYWDGYCSRCLLVRHRQRQTNCAHAMYSLRLLLPGRLSDNLHRLWHLSNQESCWSRTNTDGDTFDVGSGKSGAGRGVGMATVVVDAITLGCLKNFSPGLYIHRRISGKREYASVVLAAQEGLEAVYGELSTFGGKVAHAEICYYIVFTLVCGKGHYARLLRIAVYVYMDAGLFLLYGWVDLYLLEIGVWGRFDVEVAQNAVPVGLCAVGPDMRALDFGWYGAGGIVNAYLYMMAAGCLYGNFNIFFIFYDAGVGIR